MNESICNLSCPSFNTSFVYKIHPLSKILFQIHSTSYSKLIKKKKKEYGKFPVWRPEICFGHAGLCPSQPIRGEEGRGRVMWPLPPSSLPTVGVSRRVAAFYWFIPCKCTVLQQLLVSSPDSANWALTTRILPTTNKRNKLQHLHKFSERKKGICDRITEINQREGASSSETISVYFFFFV